jgi:hypothetical protein
MVIRSDDATLWSFSMLLEGPLVSRVPAPLRSIDSCSTVVIRSSTRPLQVKAVNTARSDPPTPRARACARRSGGSKSGRRARRRRGSGDESAGNREVKSSGCARRRRAMGDGLPPRGGIPRPPRPEPRRRQRRQRLGRARKYPPPGILRERHCAPQRRRRASRDRLGVQRRPHQWRQQRPSSPQGIGNGDSPPYGRRPLPHNRVT